MSLVIDVSVEKMRLGFLVSVVLSIHLIGLTWFQTRSLPSQFFVEPVHVQINMWHAATTQTTSPEQVRERVQKSTHHAAHLPVHRLEKTLPALQPSRQSEQALPVGSLVSANESTKPSSLSAAEPEHSAAPAETSKNKKSSDASGASALQKVILPSSNAEYLKNPPPLYPQLSQRLGEQGRVVIKVLISKSGVALDSRIEQSSGFQRLDQAAQNAVMGWRYVPGQRAGEAQDMWFNVPVNFALN
ncbi:energy transducer TonB [Rhodoferax sp.]|uniref:energy transducer TonB n=1 Tax=Rhodoferax sp. TaxID=50421 RepID=UPI00260C8D44|nr:energy transducer TonB [Rhodoferax sp.]MDD4942669.1 energy transducer TonB [Rhodoferax sp.]MDD5478203.1 energy transducer TonB [Rhodoferax sp.]